MIVKLDYNYKTDFGIWRENQEFERQKNARSRPPLDSNPVGSCPKTLTLTTYSSKHKEKAQKEYVLEDTESEPSSSDSSSSESDSSYDSKYKNKRRNKKKKHRKRNKKDSSDSSLSDSDSSLAIPLV